jgi:RND family efflux transporter MFP subunit
MTLAPRRRALLLLAGLLAAAAGCNRATPPLAKTAPATVTVAAPEVRYDVVESEDFTGRTEAIEFIEVRSRVTGYLKEIKVEDGAKVKKDDPLFVIDPDPYQREFDRTEAAVKQAKAVLDKVTRDYKRLEAFKGKAISQEEWDRVVGEKAESEAALEVAEKARRLAEVNLSYTVIKASFSGRVSRRYVHPGALIKADETILTVLSTVDPIYVNFDIDDRTALRIRKLITEGKVPPDWLMLLEGKTPPAGEGRLTVRVGLPDEDEDFSLSGTINFVNTYIDPGTGTLRVRAEVRGENLRLPPGLFVRVRLPIGMPRRAVLVPEEAIGTDQDKKFVYVVVRETAPDGKVTHRAQYRQVKLSQQVDQMRVVESGVGEGEPVIVSGLQRVRDRAEVNPQPSSKAPAPPTPPPPSPGPSSPPTQTTQEKPSPAPPSRPAGG